VVETKKPEESLPKLIETKTPEESLPKLIETKKPEESIPAKVEVVAVKDLVETKKAEPVVFIPKVKKERKNQETIAKWFLVAAGLLVANDFAKWLRHGHK